MVIVTDTLFGQQSGAERFLITIEIGMPFKWGGISPTEWACSVKVTPFHSTTTHGEGALQALCLALQWVRSELNGFKEKGGSLSWEDGQECNLGVYWPANPW